MVSIPIGRWKDWLEDYFSLFCFDEREKKKKKKGGGDKKNKKNARTIYANIWIFRSKWNK